MPPLAFTVGMAEEILKSEDSPQRFERFCIALYQVVDGVDYLPTSPSWDMGRDAKASSIGVGSAPPVLICSLSDDPITKAAKDIDRLLSGLKPRCVRFCSSQRLSEATVDKIENLIRSKCLDIETVRVEGVLQISEHLRTHPQPLTAHYPGELTNLKQALALSQEDASQVTLTGMRIALTTQLHQEGAALRADVTRNLILTALSDHGPSTRASLAKWVSDSLRLGRVVHESYLRESLVALSADRFVTFDDPMFSITERGAEEVRERSERGAKNLVEGKRLLKDQMLSLVGTELSTDDFNRLWNTLQDALVDIFHENGMFVVEAVASIIEGHTTLGDQPDFQDHLSRLRDRISGAGIGGDHAEEIAQGVVDTFYEKESAAFRWLSELCMVYVCICALGLEPKSQQQIVARLREIGLILDTDIVLSFLSEGESNHETVQDLVKIWKEYGGRIAVTKGILNEVAYHAWISQVEYDQTSSYLHMLDPLEAQHHLDNVFVRGFLRVAAPRLGRNRWNGYISMFRGTAEYDYSRIIEYLEEDGITLVSEEASDDKLAKAIEDKLYETRKESSVDSLAVVGYKCANDGRLLSLLIGLRQQKKSLGYTPVIVSSSTTLRAAAYEHKGLLQETHGVLPIGAIAYLMAMVPGTTLGLRSLRTIMFDVGFSRRLPPLERLTMRVLKVSEEYSLKWSRRNVLRREMHRQIGKVAAQRGEQAGEFRARLSQPGAEQDELLPEIIAAAVDRITASHSELEVDKLRAEVRRLRGG